MADEGTYGVVPHGKRAGGVMFPEAGAGEVEGGHGGEFVDNDGGLRDCDVMHMGVDF